MAGGEGKRLRPLTTERCKPAVPFGGRYRIIDFVLSNLINSEIRAIYLLVQYKPQSLIEHIRKGWTISPMLPEQFVTVVPPQMDSDTQRYRGTADAVYQSLNLLKIHRPGIVAVFGADHIYRMDVRQMVRFHRECQADVSVAALPVSIKESPNLGIIDANPDNRIVGFYEKPQVAPPIPSRPDMAYASMGNYLFNTEVLIDVLESAHGRGEMDFGYEVIPRLVQSHRVYAYNFGDNVVPGIRSYEEPSYWRDVGNLDTYYEAHKDVLGREPRFDLFNPQWPVFSSHYQGPVARSYNSELDNCLLGASAVVDNACVRNSIIRRETIVEPGAYIEDCIIMDYVRIGRGAQLRRVIVDRHNHIEQYSTIGYDLTHDKRYFQVTPAGVVVVPKGSPDYYGRDAHGSEMGYME